LGGYLVAVISGSAPRFLLANPPYRRDRWFTIAGEISFRF
jgi:hypothetical protein